MLCSIAFKKRCNQYNFSGCSRLAGGNRQYLSGQLPLTTANLPSVLLPVLMTTLSYRPAGGGRCQPASDSHITSETICSRRRKCVNTCRSGSLDLLFIGALYDATLPSHQRWWIVPNWAECPSLSPRVTSFCRSCPQTCVKFRASNENADPKPDQTSSVHPGQDDSASGSPSAVFVTVACSWLLV